MSIYDKKKFLDSNFPDCANHVALINYSDSCKNLAPWLTEFKSTVATYLDGLGEIKTKPDKDEILETLAENKKLNSIQVKGMEDYDVHDTVCDCVGIINSKLSNGVEITEEVKKEAVTKTGLFHTQRMARKFLATSLKTLEANEGFDANGLDRGLLNTVNFLAHVSNGGAQYVTVTTAETKGIRTGLLCYDTDAEKVTDSKYAFASDADFLHETFHAIKDVRNIKLSEGANEECGADAFSCIASAVIGGKTPEWKNHFIELDKHRVDEASNKAELEHFTSSAIRQAVDFVESVPSGSLTIDDAFKVAQKISVSGNVFRSEQDFKSVSETMKSTFIASETKAKMLEALRDESFGRYKAEVKSELVGSVNQVHKKQAPKPV